MRQILHCLLFVFVGSACNDPIEGLSSPGIEIGMESTVEFAPTMAIATRYEVDDGIEAPYVQYQVQLVADHGNGSADSLLISDREAPSAGTVYDVVSPTDGPVEGRPTVFRLFRAGDALLFESGTAAYPVVGTTEGSLLSINVDLTFENGERWTARVAELLDVRISAPQPPL